MTHTNFSHEAASGSVEKADRKLLMYSLGGAALGLSMYHSGRYLAKRSLPYAHTILDRLDITEREGHPQSVNIFKTFAESFGVNVTAEHTEYWRSMLTVTGALDALIDKTQPDSLSREVDALLAGEPIPGISKADAEMFYKIVSNASAERHDTIMAGLEVDDTASERDAPSDLEDIWQTRRKEGEIFAQKIEDIAKKMRLTSDPRELLRLRREEARLYGRIMTLDNPARNPSIKAFNESFLELCEAAYLLDSFIDLIRDHSEGVTAVSPTPSNYLVIGKEAARANFHSLSKLPQQTITRLAVASVKKAVRKTLKVQAVPSR